MGIDLQYLLLLQNLRLATGGVFNEFFNAISKVAVDVLPFLPFLIYLSVSKKWGYRCLTTYYGADLLNGAVKLTVCAYRPWIRSELIEPAGDSKVAATGYSFPSGHTVSASSLYGSVVEHEWNRRRWLAVLCAICILLTGFSRNFLGVHTPQDVIVGLTEGIVMIIIVKIVSAKLDAMPGDNTKTLDMLSLAGILVVIAVLIYIHVKPYPMDYVDGKLLVDPQVMMNDCFKACGGFLGLSIGSYVERHYIHYEIPKGYTNLPVVSGVSVALLFIWKHYFEKATIIPALGGHWGNLISRFGMVMCGIVVIPIIIMKCAAADEASES